MARRRLMTILATTCVAGMVSVPALADPLDLVTDPVEETTTDDTLDPVADLVEEVVDTDLEVDVAPSDEDGSPQLEVDGGATVGDQEVDLGGATDPVEEVIDPDPTPPPSPDGSDTSPEGERRAGPTAPDGPGGLLAGGGVVAAGDGARPAGTDGGAGTTSGSRPPSGGFDLGDLGVTRFGGGTADVDRVPDPEVAPPLADGSDVVEAPTVLDPEAPAVMAGGVGATAEDGNVVTALLRALAAALVLGTGAAWTRKAAPAVTRAP